MFPFQECTPSIHHICYASLGFCHSSRGRIHQHHYSRSPPAPHDIKSMTAASTMPSIQRATERHGGRVRFKTAPGTELTRFRAAYLFIESLASTFLRELTDNRRTASSLIEKTPKRCTLPAIFTNVGKSPMNHDSLSDLTILTVRHWLNFPTKQLKLFSNEWSDHLIDPHSRSIRQVKTCGLLPPATPRLVLRLAVATLPPDWRVDH